QQSSTHPMAALSPVRRKGELKSRLFAGIRRLATHAARWIKTAAAYYEAAAALEQLSRLSDAELGRRGLTRATLARDVTEAYENETRTGKNAGDRWLPPGVVVPLKL